ncbi:Diaminopimelate epimerase [Beijerinckiaceae bacterium RH AL1]|nr:Diaminopimelate epimerase [Beijerinckiaceae bacterium RH CH11]VVB47299.1 Diaminopimelate epimerase [Beijerinckiaceae bacterium RH AL8]VVC55773.1 Diaminopimelate epimerase [Beijerinckiaceae bacterium RH AL1]
MRDALAIRNLVRMNGAGNAIVVADLRGTDLVPTADEARAIAAAPGLAFDQLMTIHDPVTAGTDAFLRIYNVDGSLAGACGNGTRCVAWVMLQSSPRETLRLETQAGQLECRRVGTWDFSVDMGSPVFDWARIPLRSGADDFKALDLHIDDPAVAALGRPYALSMGNPHAVFFVEDAAGIDIGRLGPPVEHAPAFPERANVSFAQVVDDATIRLRVWERGAGATLACGTGACATLVAAAATGRTRRKAEVTLPGGTLTVEWRADDHVIMTGPVELEGETTLAAALRERAA